MLVRLLTPLIVQRKLKHAPAQKTRHCGRTLEPSVSQLMFRCTHAAVDVFLSIHSLSLSLPPKSSSQTFETYVRQQLPPMLIRTYTCIHIRADMQKRAQTTTNYYYFFLSSSVRATRDARCSSLGSNLIMKGTWTNENHRGYIYIMYV